MISQEIFHQKRKPIDRLTALQQVATFRRVLKKTLSIFLSQESLATYSRLLIYVRPHRKVLIIAIILSTLTGALSGSPVLFVEKVFNEIFGQHNRTLLYLVPALVVLVYLLKGVCFYWQTYLMEWVGQRIVFDIRNRLFSHIVWLPLGFFTRSPTGLLMSRISNDVSQLQLGLTKVMTELLEQLCTLIFLVVYLFTISWKLAFFSFVIVPITLAPVARFTKRLRRASRQSQERMADLNNTMFETFYGIQVIKAFNMEPRAVEKFTKFNSQYFRAILKAKRIDALSPALMEWIGAIGASIMVILGGEMVIQAKMDQGTLLAFITGLFMMYRPLKKLGSFNYFIQKAAAAGDRIFEILDQSTSVTDAPHALNVADFNREISFQNVGFCYGDTIVLRDINFSAHKGEVIALVGASGAGKTTLISLIPRFYDVTSGRITIDDTDLRDIILRSLRELIGIVSQETVLFNDTVANNIAYGRSDVPMEKIREAAQAAFADSFISKMPDGYATQIRERGANLSGGEKQRIAIARALVKNPPILILDEATSSLDTESEAEIQKALENLMRNRTTFVIAHRLSTIRNANKILVMKDGQIVEHGTHDELITLGQEYKKLYDLQFRFQNSDVEYDVSPAGPSMAC